MLEDLDPDALRERYLAATPWPHLVADDVVPPELAVDAAAEVALLPRRALVRRRSRRQVKISSTGIHDLGPRTRELLRTISGPEITELAERVTGISGLTADPEFCRAGVFVTPPGGWQRVHEDFPVHPQTGLWNRVVVLLYCSGYGEGSGGKLELWPPDMTSVGRRIEPRPGRLVMFETMSTHPHGVEALAPNEHARVVLASRLYSREPPPATPSPPLLRWSRRPDERRRDVWPSPAEAARELRARMMRSLSAHKVAGSDRDTSY